MKQAKELEQIFASQFGWHKARIKYLSLFIIALIQVRTLNLVKIAQAFGTEAKINSNYRRIQRFFKGFEINMTDIAKILTRMLG